MGPTDENNNEPRFFFTTDGKTWIPIQFQSISFAFEDNCSDDAWKKEPLEIVKREK